LLSTVSPLQERIIDPKQGFQKISFRLKFSKKSFRLSTTAIDKPDGQIHAVNVPDYSVPCAIWFFHMLHSFQKPFLCRGGSIVVASSIFQENHVVMTVS